MKQTSKSNIYVGLICLLAGLFLIYLVSVYSLPSLTTILLWTLLTILLRFFSVELPGGTITITADRALIMVAMIVNGPILAPLILALGHLFGVRKVDGKYFHTLNTPVSRTLFNIGQLILYPGIMGVLYYRLGGGFGVISLLPTVVVVLSGTALNFLLVEGLVYFSSGTSLFQAFRWNAPEVLISNIIQGTGGALLASIYLVDPRITVFLLFVLSIILHYVVKQHVKIANNYMSTMQVVNRLLEAKDPYTFGHASRVSAYALKLATGLGLNEKELERIKMAAELHDIGKIGVNDAILNKPAKLTEDEYNEIKRHPSLGAEIVAEVDFLQDCVDIVRHHHERYDGNGYPDGLSGISIPKEAAIISLADAYDAMTSERPYREALTKKEALQEIKDNAGTQFDPHLAKIFIEVIKNGHNSHKI